MDNREEELMDALRRKVVELSMNMEKMKLAEYVNLLNSPWRLLWVNFISGIARGLGIAIGFAILGALALIFMQRLVALNLPVIGGIIADIVQIVQQQLNAKTY